MLISESKQSDLEELEGMLETLASVLRTYKKTGDEKYVYYIESFSEYTDNLKKRIATHDYTKDDAILRRIDDDLDRMYKRGKYASTDS